MTTLNSFFYMIIIENLIQGLNLMGLIQNSWDKVRVFKAHKVN